MATAKQIIDLALSQVGVAEVGETNNVKYNTEYYGHTVHDPDPTTGEYVYPWCVVFVWWVFRHANASSLFCGGEKTAYAGYVYDYYRKLGRVYPSPKVGDILVIHNGIDYSHAGIIYSVTSASKFNTIDGNSGDKVAKKARTTSDSTYYFCRPAYDENDSGGSTGTLSTGSSGAAVKSVQQKLMMLGYNCGTSGADGDFGSGTLTAVKNFQSANGLTVDGIVGANTHAKLDAKYNALNVFTATCNLEGLKVRTGDSTSYAIFSAYPSLKKGEKVKVARVTSNNWYFALVGERYVAYMAAKYMKKG